MCEIIEFEGKKLEAVPCEFFECEGCYFYNLPSVQCDNIECNSSERSDNQNVVFVEVVDNSKTLLPADEFDALVNQLEDNSKEPTPLMREILELSLEDTFKVKKVN